MTIWMPAGRVRTVANGRAADLNLVLFTGSAFCTGGACPTKSSNFTDIEGMGIGGSSDAASHPLPLYVQSDPLGWTAQSVLHSTHSMYSVSLPVIGVLVPGEISLSDSASESRSLDDMNISLSDAAVESSPASDLLQLLLMRNSPGIQERGTELERRAGAAVSGSMKSTKVFFTVIALDTSEVMPKDESMTEREDGIDGVRLKLFLVGTRLAAHLLD
mmetsp:Transcript_64084/g.114342  ORF Transcript_64084/g.114342 Transcript_64084/m.114342 type:complete len:217 (-) Transcript_64084:7-657(-)